MDGQAVQDYLKAILALGLAGRPVTTGALAARLGVAPPSVTNMVKRLARAGLARRARYGPISLTAAGRSRAVQILRRHHLIELYLVRVLGLPLIAAHGEAERLEHAVSARLEARLDEALGRPLRVAAGAAGRRAS